MAKGQVSSGWKKSPGKRAKSRDDSDEKSYKPLKTTGEWGTFEPKEKSRSKKPGQNKPRTAHVRGRLGDVVKKPFFKKTIEDRPSHQISSQDKPYTKRVSNDKPSYNKSSQDRPYTTRSSEDKPYYSKSSNEKPRHKSKDRDDKPSFGRRTSEDKPFVRKTSEERPRANIRLTKNVKPVVPNDQRPRAKKNDSKIGPKKVATDLKRINRNLNFKREETKTNARKDWTSARCIVCKQNVVLPFKPRNPDIYCDVCVKKYKYTNKAKSKPVVEEKVDSTKFVRKKAPRSKNTYSELH